MELSKSNPVIIITGASSGIGEATARLCAKNRFRVILAARRLERLQSLADQIRESGGEALIVKTDLTQLPDIQHLVEITLKTYGRIDLLFNNAGFGRLDWLENLDPIQDIEAQIHTNLEGLILMARAVLPHMIQRRSGHIINMVSLAGLVATPTYSIYAATKFAVRGFTDALRREVGVYGIHVSGIYPGAVKTEFSLHTGPRRKVDGYTPAWLRLDVEKVAQIVLKVIKQPRRMVIIPWPMIFGVWFVDLFPSLSDKAMELLFVKSKRKGQTNE